MQTLEELYRHLLKQGANGKPLAIGGDADPKLIDCLTHPEDKPLIWRVKPCLCPPDSTKDCQTACELGRCNAPETTALLLTMKSV